MTKSFDFRLAAIRCYETLHSLRKTAEIFSVAHCTIWRWFQSKDSLSTKTNRTSKISPQIISTLKYLVKTNPCQSANTLRKQLSHIFSISISLSLCYTALKRAGLTRKKVRKHYLSKNLLQRNEVFKNEIFKHSVEDLVFVDETSVQNTAFPIYGYSEKGRILSFRPPNAYKKASAAVAISVNGVHNTHIIPKSFKSSDFLLFLQNLNIKEGSILVLDNASIHKTKEVKNFAAQKKWSLCFTPPGSPDCNPIENYFAITKQKLRELHWQCFLTNAKENLSDMFKEVLFSIDKLCFPKLVRRAKTFWSVL